MTFWTGAGAVGATVAAWLGVLALLWRFGRGIVRGIAAHVTATTANTEAIAKLTASVDAHIQTTRQAVTQLDGRLTALEKKEHQHAA